MAAQRMAFLISSIRAAEPNETITIMAHSQGTMIALLAQAILHDQGKRYADCLILVDSPYSFNENFLHAASFTQPDAPIQTVQAKLQTMLNIVTACTQTPHKLPDLKDLEFSSGKSGGRAGHDWNTKTGKRLDLSGKPITFDERDNRGRVYLYFCNADSTVKLPNVLGIGRYGIPDTLKGDEYYWDGTHTRPQSITNTYPAMTALAKVNFRQRAWVLPDGESPPPLVGMQPQVIDVPDIGKRNINGDALKPPFAPRLHGGEAKEGSGKDAPDAVTQDLALGNPTASFLWKPISCSSNSTVDSLKAHFNAGKDLGDQTREVQFDGAPFSVTAWREETPNEAKARMSQDPNALVKNGDPSKVLDGNSYHSAILRSPFNQRWGTSMDVAIGQAKTMDSKDWQALWIAMADWKTPIAGINTLSKFEKLAPDIQNQIQEVCIYYQKGTIPSWTHNAVQPSLVVSETREQRANPERPMAPVNWDFSGLAR
jgi:hypothetical protein